MSPRSQPNILVVNLHSTQNAGDAALLEMTIRALQGAFPEPQIALAMNEPDASFHERDAAHVLVVRSFASLCEAFTAGAGALRQVVATARVVALSLPSALWYRASGRPPRWLPVDMREILSVYMTADLVVSCPGNIFASVSRIGKPFLLSAFAVAYALLLRKPLYVLPQSIGPLRARWQRVVLREIYTRARLICLREPVSLRLARAIGLPSARLRLIPDLAFVLPPSSSDEAARFLAGLGMPSQGPRLGVTVVNRLLRYVDEATWDQYEAVMARTLTDHLHRHGGSVIFFPQVIGPSDREDDRNAARRIVGAMGCPEQAIVVNEPMTPSLLKASYGLMDVFIGTRMHSVIFAVSMNVPTLMIEYLAKARGLAEMLNLEPWRLELTQIDESALGGLLEQLWEERFTVRQTLASIVPGLCDAAGSAGTAIAEDFYGG
jgi:colanic acid/amylovoran biosynthesis protein